MHRLLFRALALTPVLVLAATATSAQETTLTRWYEVKAKPGMGAQLEAAIRDHAEWRKANNDPWTWSVWMPETGDALDKLSIGSGGHTWADFDAYDQGFGPEGLMHWNANVAPLIESVSSSISMNLPDNSQPPPDGAEINFVTVTAFHIRPGMQPRFNELVTQATSTLRDANWPGYWVWVTDVSGPERGPLVVLASLFESWADMAEPDPSFGAVMTQAHGEDGFMEWTTSLGETLRGTEAVTYRFRPDLSVMPN